MDVKRMLMSYTFVEQFVISGGFTMVDILVSWSMWLSAKSKEGLNLLALILIDISPRATQFVFKLRSCSY